MAAVRGRACACVRNDFDNSETRALAGAGRIIVADLYPLRLEIARKLGTTHTINPKETDLKAEVLEITEGNGPDVVFDAGNTAATFPLALDQAVRNAGRIAAQRVPTQ